jgi:hypothetical protein
MYARELQVMGVWAAAVFGSRSHLSATMPDVD